MFIKTLTDTISNEQITLAFIKSLNVQAFPCGRRRSIEYDESNGNRIPFDPEARLNTEANNVKHSSLNGFTQTYLSSWDESDRYFVTSLAGYTFKVDLDEGYVAPNDLGIKLATADLLGTAAENIYLNILIENTPLFRGEPRGYDTSVLSSLAASTEETALDLFARDDIQASSIADDYYFSGLSFSSRPLASALRKKYATDIGFDTRDDFSFSASDDNQTTTTKRVVSLHLLKKVDGLWQIHEPSRLPLIAHGEEANSAVVGILHASSLVTNDINAEDAYLGNADVENITVTSELAVSNLEHDAKINANIVNADSANIKAIEATAIVANKISVGEACKPVPVLELKESNGYYQLQFTIGN